MQLDRHESNSRSKFSTSLDKNNLNFLSNESLEVAIQSIKLDTSAYNVIESISEIPDIVFVHKIDKLDSVLGLMQIGTDNVMTEFGANDKIEYENKTYIFDERSGVYELGAKALTVHDFHTGFSSVNFIFDSDESKTTIIQLLFIERTEMLSFWDFQKWFQSMFRNIVFKFKKGESMAAYLGENIVKYLSVGPRNKKKTVKRLVDLTNIHPEVININENAKKLLMRVINYDYILVDKKTTLRSEESLLKPMLLGIRSNISDHSIRNNIYDQIVAIFNINNLTGVREIEFKNPIFYPTRKEKLCNATFELVDFLTNERPYFDVGSPTIINCLIRPRMKEHNSFAVMLDSSCNRSRTLYDENSPTNFRIELPERIILPENWGVSLKSLFLTNTLYNITSDKFFMSYEEEYRPGDGNLPLVEYGPPRPGRRMPERYYLNELQGRYEYHVNEIGVKPGCYKYLSQLVDAIQESFDEHNIRLDITTANNKTITIKTKSDVDGGTFKLKFSPYLSFTLGLTNDLLNGFEKTFKKSHEVDTIAEVRLKMLNPKYIIVCADIVDETIFSGEQVKLLRMLVNIEDDEQHILNFEFLHDEVKNIKIREFSSIHIIITDITGHPILTDSNIPTLLQLQFLSKSEI